MKKLKVLQLASFEGNIGDNANISGTRKLLSNNLNYELEFSNLEIREFFWKERSYNEEFADYVNQFDLFIFGGGNFFELWVDHSCNNTSVDIDIPILEKIKTPTIFYSLGMDPGMGVTEKGIGKFKKWLDYVISQDRFLLSLRNDGAHGVADKYLGEAYSKHFHFVPDGGFFTQVDDWVHPELDGNEKTIGMNLAGDMLDIRFGGLGPDDINADEFLTQLGAMFNELFEQDQNLHLVLFPHIYKDLAIVSDFMYKLKDKHARRKVTVAPYLNGFSAQSYIFDAYRKCNVIIGNRFHTNVCAIGLAVPTVGFVNYRQIRDLYDGLDLTDRSVEVNKKGFEKRLQEKILQTLADPGEIQDLYKEKVEGLAAHVNAFHKHVNDWLPGVMKG